MFYLSCFHLLSFFHSGGVSIVATSGVIIRDVKQLLTEKEAAAILRRPVMTLRWWRQAQRGPAWIKDGIKVLYSEAAIEEYIESNTHTPSVRATLEGKRVSL